jgi:hypothetical protein
LKEGIQGKEGDHQTHASSYLCIDQLQRVIH